MATSINKRKKHFNRFGDLKSEFDSYWKPLYRDVSDYIYMQGGRFDDTESYPNDGKRRDSKILKATASIAHRTLQSGLYGAVTSPTSPWFRMTIDDPILKEIGAVKQYFDKVTRIILADLAKSNFYTAAEILYGEIGAFGTSAIQIESDFDTIFNFIPYTVGQYYIDTSWSGRVDTIFRKFPMRARNVIDMFGEDKVSQRVKNTMLHNKPGNDWVEILHIQEPNTDRDVTKLDSRNKPFVSTYYEFLGKGNEPPLRVAGYDTQPFTVTRWSVTGSANYGIGPGVIALGDTKMLQTLVKMYSVGVQKQVEPPMVAIGASGSVSINTGANGVTWVDGVLQPQGAVLSPAYQVNINLADLEITKVSTQQDIDAIFFADLWRSLSSFDKSRQTATEFVGKQREQLRLLGPISERMHPDFLRPTLARVFDLENKAGRLPEPPQEIRGKDIKVEIISLLAQAQRLAAVTPIEQLIAATASMTQIWPEARHKINSQQVVDTLGEAYGVTPDIINSDEVVAAIEAEEARQLAQQEADAKAQQAVSSAKELSETDVSGNNALTALTGAQ